jgi:hypothetical protein
MKYLIQIYGNDTREQFEARSAEEKQELYAAWGALNQTPGMTPGVELDAPSTATTVRVEDGKTLVTDGPFVDVKEALGGIFYFEADDLDAAIEVASRVPTARLGGAIEIRPLVER